MYNFANQSFIQELIIRYLQITLSDELTRAV